LIVFELSVTAGASHPKYPKGLTAAATCFVDSNDVVEARRRAVTRLSQLGWDPPEFEGPVIQLPPDPDLSHLSQTMLRAVGEARELGVCVVVYPEKQH
jgi:hypothetical protein